jgi:hypothetical protein
MAIWVEAEIVLVRFSITIGGIHERPRATACYAYLFACFFAASSHVLFAAFIASE